MLRQWRSWAILASDVRNLTAWRVLKALRMLRQVSGQKDGKRLLPNHLRQQARLHEAAVLELGRARGADRPTIDAGRGAAHEDVAVEASVPALESAVVGPVIEQFHSGTLLHTCA
jgi:hypothetical protein